MVRTDTSTTAEKKQKDNDAIDPFLSNPRLNNIDRAPYELGYLLRELPRYPSDIDRKNKDKMQCVAAARDHAREASNTLTRGLNAIGSLMFIAGAYAKDEMDVGCIADLGCLIRHIAVELQLLHEINDEFTFVLNGSAQ